MTVRSLNAVLRSAEERALELEARLIAILEPILEQAGRDAARAFRAKATDHLSAAGAQARRDADAAALRRAGGTPPPLALAAALDVRANSTMVCVKPRPAEAAAVVDPDGGSSADSLHVTLAYLGEIDGDLEPVLEALRAVAASHAPLSGVVGGYGQFGMPDGSRVGILLPDVPGLVELRVAATEALEQAGIDYGRQHGFEAHLTVDPDPEPGELEKMIGLSGSPLHFDDLIVVRGDVEVHPLPLVGVPPLTASGEPSWSAPAGDEILDVHKLARTLRGKTDPVRNAVVETVMGKALRDHGISFDVENPLVRGVLAKAGSQVTEIARTTQLNVMRVISESYEQGLSIPDTAAAIRAGMAEAATVRATLIARTELAGAVNGGSLAATQLVGNATGVRYMKRWMTADGAPYPRHADYPDLDGQTVAVDDAFDVGGAQLQHPGDPDGPVDEIANCRCAMSYVEAGEEAPDSSDGGGGDASIAAQVMDTVSVGEGPPVSPTTLEKIERLGIEQWPPRRTALAEELLGGAADTTARHSTDGVWTEERKRLHDQIVAAHFEGKTPSGTRNAYFTAGGGASGKSHALFVEADGREIGLEHLAGRADVIAIDPDRIKMMLPEYKVLRDAGDATAASAVHEESSLLAKRITDQARADGFSTLIDTTGSSASFTAKLEAAANAGYDVHVTMFSIPTNEAITRSVARGERSGRYVAIQPLKSAHKGASAQLAVWKDVAGVGHWRVYDNSLAPRLVAEGGNGKTIVYDQGLWEQILAKADE